MKKRVDLVASLKQRHYPDILDCMAQISPNEVPTPPKVVQDMLAMLPQELFTNPNTKFLDPCSKSAVFLREIARKLIDGLAERIPDLQERINHIFTKQLYGLSITELTGFVSRRTLYCSKEANSKYSVCKFDNSDGNIFYERVEHKWEGNKCVFCGASKKEWNRGKDFETHAYSFIHSNSKLLKRLKDMKFDVIIGNPPYQLNLGNEGGNNSKAKAIYQNFISQAIKLNPRYLSMIVPSRWMTRTAEGISDEWITAMLHSNHFMVIHDFENEKDCFQGVDIKGGVNYFLWNHNYCGKCQYFFHHDGNQKVSERVDYLDSLHSNIVIRNPQHYSIIEQIMRQEGNYFNNERNNFSGFVSSKDFFTNKETLTSKWKGYQNSPDREYYIKCYLNKSSHQQDYGYVKESQISKHLSSKDLHKVYIPAAAGTGTDAQVLGKPFYGEPNSVCSQTYLVIGYDPNIHHLSKKECENIISYIKTRFFRYLVSIKKKTQNGPRGVYQFVPMQDFSQGWSDEKLYKKYNLTQEEINFIESMIKPMA